MRPSPLVSKGWEAGRTRKDEVDAVSDEDAKKKHRSCLTFSASLTSLPRDEMSMQLFSASTLSEMVKREGSRARGALFIVALRSKRC